MSFDMFPDSAIDYLLSNVATETDQVWFVTDYDTVWATTAAAEDILEVVEEWEKYIFFYGPTYSSETFEALQPPSVSAKGGMFSFPPPFSGAAKEQSGTGVGTASRGGEMQSWEDVWL